MKLKVTTFSQRDDRWASTLLGYNTSPVFSIGNYGCLITCFGMYLDKTPDNINQILKDNGGFENGGNFIWSKCNALGLNQVYVSPRYDGPVSPQGLTKMKELLENNFPLACEIDFNPSTPSNEMHFVLVIGFEGDEFFIADPWTGEILSLDVYGGAERAVLQFRAYDKRLPLDENGDTIPVLKTDFERLVTKSTITDEIAKLLNKEISQTVLLEEIKKLITYEDKLVEKDKQLEQANQKILALDKQLSELGKQHQIIAEEKETLENKVKELSILSEDQGISIKTMTGEIEKLKETVTETSLDGWQLIKRGIKKILGVV